MFLKREIEAAFLKKDCGTTFLHPTSSLIFGPGPIYPTSSFPHKSISAKASPESSPGLSRNARFVTKKLFEICDSFFVRTKKVRLFVESRTGHGLIISVLSLLYRIMQIFIKALTGKTITLEIESKTHPGGRDLGHHQGCGGQDPGQRGHLPVPGRAGPLDPRWAHHDWCPPGADATPAAASISSPQPLWHRRGLRRSGRGEV